MDIKLQPIDEQPQIRINIFKRQSHLDLKYPVKDFELHTTTGKKLFESAAHNGYWRIKVKTAEPRRYDYFLILREAEKRAFLEDDLKSFHKVMLQHVGGRVIFNDKPITKNDKYMELGFTISRDEHDPININYIRVYPILLEKFISYVESIEVHKTGGGIS